VLELRAFARFLHGWFLRTPWTPRRALVAAAFVLVVPVLEGVIWFSLALDRIVFPAYRRTPVRAPIFIAGHPRSGTTFLHRLMAEDRRHFCAMRMWEILLAPSISLRKLVTALTALDRLAGRPAARVASRLERHWRDRNPMHEVSFAAPEEDDYLLLHRCSALTIGLSSGLLEEARPFVYFDQALPGTQRRRIMRFYREQIRRHLYAHNSAHNSAHAHAHEGGGRCYLAKNPALCPKLESLAETFPEARIVYLVRDPLEAVPSYESMMRYTWETLGVPGDDHARRRFLLDMARHWYLYPLQWLSTQPAERYLVVYYRDLVADPEATVRRIFRHFGLPIDAAFAETLAAARTRAASYHSRHVYDAGSRDAWGGALANELHDVREAYAFT